MRVLITGAAGFVGSHAARFLHAEGWDVVATDMVDRPERLAAVRPGERWRYVSGSLLDVLAVVMPDVEQVWHFAANADIPLGARDTGIDLRESVALTHGVLEAMREHGVGTIVFPSSSAVYGNHLGPRVSECHGPLQPASLYGAGKVAAEALISAYGSVFGIRGVIARLGNVVGGQMGRGIVRDFLHKLQDDPSELTVMGDGRQRKSYVLVDDVISAMSHLAALPPARPTVQVFNVAAGDSLDVRGVAFEVARALGTPPPVIVAPSREVSWSGDQPVVELDTDRLAATGWRSSVSAAQAVFIAAQRLVDERPRPRTT